MAQSDTRYANDYEMSNVGGGFILAMCDSIHDFNPQTVFGLKLKVPTKLRLPYWPESDDPPSPLSSTVALLYSYGII